MLHWRRDLDVAKFVDCFTSGGRARRPRSREERHDDEREKAMGLRDIRGVPVDLAILYGSGLVVFHSNHQAHSLQQQHSAAAPNLNMRHHLSFGPSIGLVSNNHFVKGILVRALSSNAPWIISFQPQDIGCQEGPRIQNRTPQRRLPEDDCPKTTTQRLASNQSHLACGMSPSISAKWSSLLMGASI